MRTLVGVGAFELVLVGVLGAMVVVGAVLMPAYWRGGTYADKVDRNTRVWWPWGEPLRRGFLRSAHLAVAATALLVAMVVFVAAEDAPAGAPLPATAVVLLLAWAGVLVLAAAVVFFNRPRWAVPPRFRDEPGAMHLWRNRSPRR